MLQIVNATYTANGIDILKPQSLDISQGQHTLVSGPSGCGKTTLLNMAAGLLRPTSGDVVFNGQSYGHLSDTGLDKLRADHFGFIFQKLYLIGHLTAAQNIAVVQTVHDPQRIDDLMNDLGIAALKNRKARDLSVGEAQRVAIARAVANNPTIIFADEPTASLDDANTEKVMDMLLAQAEKTGATIIAATHDARITPRFHNIIKVAT